MRLFIAIDTAELKLFFKEFQAKIPLDLAKIKLTDSYHLTLKFLGEVPEDKLARIKESLEKVRFNPFSIIFDHLGFFPNENYIQVIWIGLKEHEKVIELQKMIDVHLTSLFSTENNFHPHMTLGRVKFVKDKINFVNKIKDINIEEKTLIVTDFRLIQSTLTEQGPIYTDLAVYRAH